MKVAIIGGGASGLACAVQASMLASEKGIKVQICVFEKNDRVGKKILASGNGRCNFTNLDLNEKNYFSKNGFSSYALSVYDAKSNIRFFENIGIFSKSDSEGRVYPQSNQASSVLDALRNACQRYNVNILCEEKIEKIAFKNGKFVLNEKLLFDKVVLSCGGMAAVKNFDSYNLLKTFGHSITPIAPSLVRLVTSSQIPGKLKGIRAAVNMSLIINQKIVATESGEILFSEKCLSGIVSMQLSSYVSRHFISSKQPVSVSVDFVPKYSQNELEANLFRLQKTLKDTPCENLLMAFMPKKIGSVILKEAGISLLEPISSLRKEKISELSFLCKNFVFKITATKDFTDAQVTIGGAQTTQFNPKTLESKKQKGLYCCGEMLDVDALCGGYNLQWAWSSGRLCAESLFIGSKLNDKN